MHAQYVPEVTNRRRRGRLYFSWLNLLMNLLRYLTLAFGLFLVLIPFFWMVSSSLKGYAEIFVYPPVWIPRSPRWENYPEALLTATHPFIPTYFANTLFVALGAVLGDVLSCSLVGFGFAHLRFPGRRWLFLLMLSTMALPYYVVMIPQFSLFRRLGWVNSFKPLIVPSFFASNGFAIFLFRQFFVRIPRDLLDAGRMDGCSTWGIFVRILVPLSKSVFATVAILGFTSYWNDFLGPLLYLSRSNLYTVSIGLALFRGYFGMQWNLLMPAATAVMLPPILLFFLFQRLFIQGIVITGVKG